MNIFEENSANNFVVQSEREWTLAIAIIYEENGARKFLVRGEHKWTLAIAICFELRYYFVLLAKSFILLV